MVTGWPSHRCSGSLWRATSGPIHHQPRPSTDDARDLMIASNTRNRSSSSSRLPGAIISNYAPCFIVSAQAGGSRFSVSVGHQHHTRNTRHTTLLSGHRQTMQAAEASRCLSWSRRFTLHKIALCVRVSRAPNLNSICGHACVCVRALQTQTHRVFGALGMLGMSFRFGAVIPSRPIVAPRNREAKANRAWHLHPAPAHTIICSPA